MPTAASGDLAPVYWKLGPADPHYGAACVLIPWYLYLYYGDRRVLGENYGMMTRWLAWLAQFEDKGLMTLERFADWCPPLNVCSMDNTPVFFVSTWFYYYALSVTAKIADVLGEQSAARTFSAHAARVKTAFIRAFVREDDVAVGLYEEYMAKIRKAKAVGPEIAASIEGTLKDMCSSRSQTPFALALVLRLLPENKVDTVTRQLLRSVIEINSYHLNTGSLGTKYLFEALSQTGHSDVACKVLTQTSYPSYGYMLREGATTIWGRWERLENVSMNSHNHSQMCDFDSWLYKSLAGIRANETQPGFRHIVLAPEIIKDLRYVRAEVDTVQGTVKSGWALSETGLEVKVFIPANCTAELRLPAALFVRPPPPAGRAAAAPERRGQHRRHAAAQPPRQGRLHLHQIGSGSYSFSLRAE